MSNIKQICYKSTTMSQLWSRLTDQQEKAITKMAENLDEKQFVQNMTMLSYELLVNKRTCIVCTNSVKVFKRIKTFKSTTKRLVQYSTYLNNKFIGGQIVYV